MAASSEPTIAASQPLCMESRKQAVEARRSSVASVPAQHAGDSGFGSQYSYWEAEAGG